MLPVRLETRFYRDPNRLCIRIYPDQIHVNSHQPELSIAEVQLGQQFWSIVWKSGWNRGSRVFAKLAETLGVWRAAWVVEATTPTNLDSFGKAEPSFSKLTPSKVTGAPAKLALLPSRWFAVGYLNGEVALVEHGEPIPDTLRFAPFDMNGTDDLDRWMVDFEAAKRVGMAIEVSLTGNEQDIINTGLDELIVVGARVDDPNLLAQSLESTLFAHYYTRGFDFVPQGTPTNNTETVRSPWQWESADTTTVFERISQPTPIIPDSNRARFAQALGLDANGIAARAAHADSAEVPSMEAMNHALWYIMWGEYLRFVLHDGEKAVLSDANIDWLRDWFVGHVRGGAMYPAFQIGSMPYGILPIQLQPIPSDTQTEDDYLQMALWNLRGGWERSLPNVPHLDPTATASATDTPITTDLEQESENLIALLSSHPHPVSFFTRDLNDLRTWPFWSVFFNPVNLYEVSKTNLSSALYAVDPVWGDHVAITMPAFETLAAQLDYFEDLLAEADARLAPLREEMEGWETTLGDILPPDLVETITALQEKIDAHEEVITVLNVILNLLNGHAIHVTPVNDLGLPHVMDVLSESKPNPEHFYFVYLETDKAWGGLPLVQAADAEGGATAVVYLDWLHDYALGSVNGTGPAGLPDPAPLLFQLIKKAIDRANAWDNSSLYDLDDFLGSINRAVQMNSVAERVNTVKRLTTNLTGSVDLLAQALKSPAKDPTRMAIASVPREVFSNASTQLREYKQASRTSSVDRAISVLDQWAAQPTSANTTPKWGGTDVVAVTPGNRVRLLANAIGTLVNLTPDELELRMKETLGLAMHRLDAWISAYAERRVDTMRVKRPTGIQIGGCGWVENLRPDEAGTLASQGFIHAPSMTQAATAAVLRSGYSAYSDGTSTSPLSVDLRSDRVRVARWMMDGLRQGQRINDLLGYHFERYLHDHFLDVWIDPVRHAVKDSASKGVIVDGLALLELWNEGQGTLESLVTVPARHTFSEIEPALEHLVWITDAMADLTLAENVHALVQGDYERASAVQNASALGDVAPPELRSILTPNSGMTITHRIMLLPQDSGSKWDDHELSVRKLLEPGLESWVANLVGAPDRVIFDVSVNGVVETGSLAKLPLSALDAVYLAPVSDQVAGSGLAALIDFTYRSSSADTILITADVPVSGDRCSLADFILLANSVRKLLGSARSATPGDFVLGAGDDPDAAAVTDLGRRVNELVMSFATAVEKIPNAPQKPALALRRLSYFNLPQAIPTSTEVEALSAQLAAVLPIAQARLNEVRAKMAALPRDVTIPQRIKTARAVVGALLGANFPVMLHFPSPLQANQIRDETQVGSNDPRALRGWLLKLARVHPDLAALRDTITAAEALQDRPLFPFWAAQIPYVTGEAWAGLSRPNAEGADRLSLVLTTNGDVSALVDAAGGLVLDQWIERIPSDYEMTGLTFHFDAPTSRPPQALLLAVPPVGASWNFTLVLDTVREAFALARLRAVAPETLGEYGHQVPAVYLTSNLDTIGAI
jgi:hypothetical protein